MVLRQLVRFSRQQIRGQRKRAALVCSLPVAAEMFFRVTEAAFCGLLLWFSSTSPVMLFTGRYLPGAAVSVVCMIMRLVCVSPLDCAGAEWINGLCQGRRLSFQDMLLRKGFVWRSIALKLLGTLAAAVPAGSAAAGLWYGASLIRSGADSRQLFIALNVAVFCALCLYFWLAVRISLAAAPFIMAQIPGISPFAAVRRSISLMSGRKRVFAGLFALYLAPSLTVVGIPIVFPELRAALAVSTGIFLKEDLLRGKSYG